MSKIISPLSQRRLTRCFPLSWHGIIPTSIMNLLVPGAVPGALPRVTIRHRQILPD
jgi:hypothetical protein